VHHVDARHFLEELAGQMLRRAASRRAVVEAAGFGPRERNQLLNRARGQRRMDHEDVGDFDQLRDRREIRDRIVVQLRIQRDVDRVARARQQYRITVGCGIRDDFGAYGAAGADARFHDDLLAPCLRQFRRDHARHDVGRAARCAERQHETDRLYRILLCAHAASREGAGNERD
jgi:hypothetical protein